MESAGTDAESLVVVLRLARLFGAHGTAMLWTRTAYQGDVVPAIMSTQTNYVAEYEYTGTRDYTAWAALNATFGFRTWLGEAALTGYTKSLADEGAEYLVDLFGTDYAVPLSMSHALTNVGLPTTNLTLCEAMTAYFLATYDAYVIPYERPQGVFWMRISNQVYLDMDHYRALGPAILQYLGISAATGGRGSRWGEQRETIRKWQAQTQGNARDRDTHAQPIATS